MKKLNQQIRDNYREEAENIEKSIEQTILPDELENMDTDALLSRIKNTIKSEEDTANTTQPVKEPLRYQIGKWVAIAAVAVIGIFGVTMTSQANRAYFVETLNHVVGKETSTDVVNQDEVLRRDTDEESARADIEERLNVEVPIFNYMPKTMVFSSYSVDIDAQVALMYYEFEEQIFVLQISAQNSAALSNYTDQGSEIELISLEHYKCQIVLLEQINSKSKNPTYSARWEYNNTFYLYSGAMEKKEFIKIIERINY